MAFGVKMRVIKTKNAYTMEELYDRIKDVQFDASTPELAKHGAVTVIAFPALDGQNQCIIQNGSIRSPYKKFQVLKTQKVGVKNMAVQEGLNVLTNDWNGLRAVVGGNAKNVEQQVTNVADTLESLNL